MRRVDRIDVQGTIQRADGCLAECVVLHHLSRGVDVGTTKILTEGMQVTANDCITILTFSCALVE